MTCNPKWPEIQNNLLPGQTTQDRPDLVARVFQSRKKQFIHDLIKGEIFGLPVAHLWVIEFQKRGLPHAHILLILADGKRPKTPQEVDKMTSAELPPSPYEAGITEEEKMRRKPLWDIVVTNMIHGPCGTEDPNAACMKSGKCEKKFPKPFFRATILDEELSHPTYRRRSPEDGGQTVILRGKRVDNRWVVPYNPYCSLRYNCHINVEICASAMASKYLFKYVTKGPDRAMVTTEVERIRDEIADYEDMRSVGSSEACWKLFAFPIAENKPPVQVTNSIILSSFFQLLHYYIVTFLFLRFCDYTLRINNMLSLLEVKRLMLLSGEEKQN